VDLRPQINSVILKENISGKNYYLTGCKSRNFCLSVIVLVVGVIVVVAVVAVVV
jgi:hypothetical protein